MNEFRIFSNNKFGNIRVVKVNNEPWFVGKDIAEQLGYSNTRDALQRHVDSEDKADVGIHDGSQVRNMIIINESGFYSLALSSKLETAKQFKRWVTSEVLPSIRKDGKYITEKASSLALQEKKIDLHKEKLDKAIITSNYLIDYVKSMSGYMPSHLLESFTTAIHAVNIDIVDSLKKMNKFNQPESRQ